MYCTVTILSVVFFCIQLQITYFLGKDNANVVNFCQKARKTNRALQLYANYVVLDNYTCKQEPTFASMYIWQVFPA